MSQDHFWFILKKSQGHLNAPALKYQVYFPVWKDIFAIICTNAHVGKHL